jgi:site-specific DNA recombinase
MRYAAYIRISSEEQVGNFSIEAQSGRSSDRPGFQKMRQEARKGKFDALVVHKFDRFARNRTDALAIKSLLRYDYGVKVFSVSEPSEDSDGPMGALIEGIMESVADWYSQNLATETTKGKRERTMQGFHNNQAPFGLRKDENDLLVADEAELPGLKLAFEQYATGRHSDGDIAQLLNRAGYQTKTKRPFSKETVRFMLQNRTYLGKIRYQQATYTADGRRSRRAPIEWLDGQHLPRH